MQSELPDPPISYLGFDQWRIERQLVVDAAPELPGVAFVVPAGFTTDLASIPRSLWWLIAPFELAIGGPVAHDWIYRNGGRAAPGVELTRAQADRVLLGLMAFDRVPKWRALAAYLAVRAFGARAWQATRVGG